ncbi:MAG: hypothetical protein RLZZ259_569 [Pseudomonadota bacterium]|jgi:uncharacterized membrane protein YphA (DoxX/SURF4 family)
MNERTKRFILIGGAIVLALVFLLFGAGKFMNPAKWIDKFTAWGIPVWFVPLAGIMEVAGAIGLLIPVLRGLAGLGLALFMIGAVLTHIVHAEIFMIFVASAILVGSATVGWLHIPETITFIRRRISGPSNTLVDKEK